VGGRWEGGKRERVRVLSAWLRWRERGGAGERARECHHFVAARASVMIRICTPSVCVYVCMCVCVCVASSLLTPTHAAYM
jgi:hypothetical protein